MISLRKINDVSELKMGMTILTICHDGCEHLEKVDCIDNGKIFTVGLYDGESTNGEDLETYLEDYEAICEVVVGYNPEPYVKPKINYRVKEVDYVYTAPVSGIYAVDFETIRRSGKTETIMHLLSINHNNALQESLNTKLFSDQLSVSFDKLRKTSIASLTKDTGAVD